LYCLASGRPFDQSARMGLGIGQIGGWHDDRLTKSLVTYCRTPLRTKSDAGPAGFRPVP
jgi:hypothetical protein